MKENANVAALLTIVILWGLNLGYPLNLLQNIRWPLFGYAIPIYFVLTVGAAFGATAAALAFKRRWLRWEIIWWALPLICLPGLLSSGDRLWSARQWLSWIVRGVIPGGVLLMTVRRRGPEPLLLYLIYPIIIAASVLGLREIYTHRNPIWDHFDYVVNDNHQDSGRIPLWDRDDKFSVGVASASAPMNPFYRPDEAMGSSLPPRGTQANRIPYASILVGFLPLGIWLLKYKNRLYPLSLLSAVALVLILALSQVRSAWAGALTALALMGAFGVLRRRREIVGIAAGTLACLAVFLSTASMRNQLIARLQSFHFDQMTIRERLDILETTTVLKKRGLVGVGFGQFPTASRTYYPSVRIWRGTPDDQYLRWAIENGIPSLLLLIAFFVGIIRAGWAEIRGMKDVQDADFYKSLLAGWFGLSVTFLFFDGFYWGACNMTFWALLGMFAACLKPADADAQ